MVYCGKPSPACARCRSRRLKCDQARPSCSQCIRAKTECPGYRDKLDIAFRDQSQEVIGKAIARRQIQQYRANSSTRTPAKAPTSQPAPGDRISFPVEELAKGYLFSHYIAEGPNGGYLSYLSTLTVDPQNRAVNAALTAVGLAALSNIRMAPRLMLTARREYTTALSQTNHALQDEGLSKKDATLAAVVLLGMFEVMTCSDASFIDRWMKHMDGAARLIEIRGLDQLTRPEGLHLFTQLRAQIMISKIYQEKYSTPILAELNDHATKYRNHTDSTTDQLGAVTIRLCNFCAAIKDFTITEPGEIIRMALSLDADFMAVSLNTPPEWSYRTVKVPFVDGEPTMQALWGESYHLYPNLTVSNMWNNCRSSRLIIHELIIDAVKDLNKTTTNAFIRHEQDNLISQSQRTSHQLVEDICASVPFHFGAGIEDPAPNTSSASAQLESVSAAGGVTLVWPLLIAANSGFASDEMRKWITECLDKIGHSMGINQALEMAKLIRAGMQSRAWLSPEYSSPSVEWDGSPFDDFVDIE